MAFRAYHVPDTSDSVKIDDVSFKNGACSPAGSCDFESGQCTWVNIHKDAGHQWVLASGGSHGPPTDHTTHTPEGTKALLRSVNWFDGVLHNVLFGRVKTSSKLTFKLNLLSWSHCNIHLSIYNFSQKRVQVSAEILESTLSISSLGRPSLSMKISASSCYLFHFGMKKSSFSRVKLVLKSIFVLWVLLNA